ncbi:MAG: cox cluster protein, partial [Halapricum sp.]
MASPWPVFVALGFALAEVGIFLGIFPVAVGGVLLFGGTIAGILTEAGYVTNLWKTTMLVGGGLLVLGVALVILQGQFGTDAMMAAIDSPNTVGHRLLSRGL